MEYPSDPVENNGEFGKAVGRSGKIDMKKAAEIEWDKPTKVVHCKKEPYDVYIGRPSKWENPYSDKGSKYPVVRVDTREKAIEAFELWLELRIANEPELLIQLKAELKGKTLGCWCSPKACHGDVLARIADEKTSF